MTARVIQRKNRDAGDVLLPNNDKVDTEEAETNELIIHKLHNKLFTSSSEYHRVRAESNLSKEKHEKRNDKAEIDFLQSEQKTMLKSLHAEIERLQRRIYDLMSNRDVGSDFIAKQHEMEATINSLRHDIHLGKKEIMTLKQACEEKDKKIEYLVQKKDIVQENPPDYVQRVNAKRQPAKTVETKHNSSKTEQLFHRKKIPIVTSECGRKSVSTTLASVDQSKKVCNDDELLVDSVNNVTLDKTAARSNTSLPSTTITSRATKGRVFASTTASTSVSIGQQVRQRFAHNNSASSSNASSLKNTMDFTNAKKSESTATGATKKDVQAPTISTRDLQDKKKQEIRNTGDCKLLTVNGKNRTGASKTHDLEKRTTRKDLPKKN